MPEVADLLTTWPSAVVLIVLVALAVVVRALLPSGRSRTRRIAALLGLAALAIAAEIGLRSLGYASAARLLEVGAQLLFAFTAVNLVVTAAFEGVLPRVGFVPAPIVYELVLVGGWGLACVAVLSVSGFDLASVAAASTVAVAILTISLQATLGNVVGGVAIQFDRSIQVGDWLVLEGGREGRVAQVRWRHTALQTRDGNLLLVPNGTLLAMTVEVVGRPGGRAGPYRAAVPFLTDIAVPPERVIRAVEEGLRAAPVPNGVLDPLPDCVIRDLGRDRPGFVTFEARMWLEDPQPDGPTVTAVALRVHSALRRAGIPFGAPTLGVHGAGPDGDLERRRVADLRRRARELVDALALFAPLDAAERERVAARIEDAPYCAGEVLVRQGWPARRLYLLARGAVRVEQETEGGPKLLARLEGPTFFGEHGLVTGEPRSATVLAETDLECYRLDKADFDELRARPAIAAALARLTESRPAPTPAAEEDPRAPEPEDLLARLRSLFRL